MIAVDTNILVYAHREEMPAHRSATERLRRLVEGNAPWALPIFCIGEFVRVVTHPRVFRPPSSLDQALGFVEHILGSPAARLLTPGPEFPDRFAQTCRDADARGNLVFDAQIAATCVEHGVREILSEDRNFARFGDVDVVRLE